MISWILLYEGEEDRVSPRSDHQTSSSLVSVSLDEVPTEVVGEGPGPGLQPLARQHPSEQLHHSQPLETQGVIAGFLLVEKQISSEIFPFQELFQSNILETNTNQPGEQSKIAEQSDNQSVTPQYLTLFCFS